MTKLSLRLQPNEKRPNSQREKSWSQPLIRVPITGNQSEFRTTRTGLGEAQEAFQLCKGIWCEEYVSEPSNRDCYDMFILPILWAACFRAIPLWGHLSTPLIHLLIYFQIILRSSPLKSTSFPLLFFYTIYFIHTFDPYNSTHSKVFSFLTLHEQPN